MDGLDQSLWQERWSGLTSRLEKTLENNAYRFLLCSATVVLITVYAIVVSRIAEPPRFVESRFIHIDEDWSETKAMTAFDVDLLNRSINRLQKLSSLLDITPQRLGLRPSLETIRKPFAIESRVLRLWLDESRGFRMDGTYDVISEAVARTIVSVVFQDEGSRARLPAASSSWYEQMKEPASPENLSPWLTSQLIAESDRLSMGAKIQYLRALVKISASPQMLEYDRANRWPTDVKKSGPILYDILSVMAPGQVSLIDFQPTLPYLQVGLEGRQKKKSEVSVETPTRGLRIGLLVVTSCATPRLVDFKEYDAREVVWARVCPKSLSSLVSLLPANSAELFAERNPDVSFVQVGLPEISYAFDRGWINSKTEITDFVEGTKRLNSRMFAYQVRPQSEEWNPKAQAFRVKAPVEVLKLVRLRTI